MVIEERRGNNRGYMGNMVTLELDDVIGETGFYRQCSPLGRETNGVGIYSVSCSISL